MMQQCVAFCYYNFLLLTLLVHILLDIVFRLEGPVCIDHWLGNLVLRTDLKFLKSFLAVI